MFLAGIILLVVGLVLMLGAHLLIGLLCLIIGLALLLSPGLPRRW